MQFSKCPLGGVPVFLHSVIMKGSREEKVREGLKARNEADSNKMSHESFDPLSPEGHKGAGFLFIASGQTHRSAAEDHIVLNLSSS